ncbi:histone deacetylase 8-like protein [Linnemannia elongata AG-77]|uniref:Histone deacetylase n=1 Tax=Linnemannia elongata AG-77 TaxID=1314771 RepID=A0A197JL83_9FUNG|nr:histone deacetylase 8-like protein [Linnemannia elongata AG-77]
MPRTAYIHSNDYAELASRLPSNIERSKKVHALIEAYGLLRLRDLTIVSPRKATVKELCRFHSRDYIEFLNKAEEYDSGEDSDEDNVSNDDSEHSHDTPTSTHNKEDKLEVYGLRFDCSVFEGLADYAAYVAGSTLQAATLLCDDAFDIVIHWDGGRHHARKDAAAGFCIVNDIVLGIMELQRTFDRVLYLDLDVHHGDGVENAFQFTEKVLTVSIHHYAEGFYPGTGSGSSSSTRIKSVVNIPMKAGLSDGTLCKVFDEMIAPLVEQFNPDAVVLQYGVDGMAGDPLGKWNLTMTGYSDCLKKVVAWKKPLLVLGGGGYNTVSTARCYAYLTSQILNRTISDEIPEHAYFEDYQPDFLLFVDPGCQADSNTEEHLDHVRSLVETQSKSLISQR